MQEGHVYVAIVTAVFLGLSWAFAGLRCYTRLRVKRQFSLDDVLAILALLAFTAFAILDFLAVQNGYGDHSWNLSPVQIASSLKFNLFGNLCYIISTCLIKISFSITLLRAAAVKYHFYTIYTVMIAITLVSIIYAVLLLVQCQPLSFLWEQLLGATAGHCEYSRFQYATYVHSAFILAADITLAIIPIPLVLPLELNLRTKVSIAFLLALGSLASIATLARILLIPTSFNQENFIYKTSKATTWIAVECGICIMVAAAATFRPLLQDTRRLTLNTSESDPEFNPNFGNFRPARLGSYMSTFTERPTPSYTSQDRKESQIANEKRIEALREFEATPQWQDEGRMRLNSDTTIESYKDIKMPDFATLSVVKSEDTVESENSNVAREKE